MTNIILKDRGAILPHSLAEHLAEEKERAEVYRLSRLRPTCCMTDFDAGAELVPSILDTISCDFRCAKILGSEDGEPWVYLELDSSVSALINARSKIRCAAVGNHYRGVVGVWLDVRETFDLRDWQDTMEFLRELCMTATVFLFVRAINRPVIRNELIPYLSDHIILGLKVLGPSRYSMHQLAWIAIAYLRALKFEIRDEERVLLELTARLARMNPSRARNALLLADYFARHAVAEDGRAVVTPETIASAMNEQEG